VGDYTGMYLATDLSDILFGTPACDGDANLGTLKVNAVNVAARTQPVLRVIVARRWA
jgi:carbon-monoxide dehydrogenase catalytic subunit